MKSKIEIFSAGCPVCDPVVKMVQELTCDSCDVTVYNMVELCDDKSCLTKAREYGVVRIPAVAVDGKLLNCCETAIAREDLISAGVGQQ